MRDREKVAVEVLRFAFQWPSDACVIGNVTAAELAQLVESFVDTCPKCGATAWVNIDCGLCCALAALQRGWREAMREQ